MEDRKDTTLPLPGIIVDLIDQQLNYGDSRAGWMRVGVYLRLMAELDTEELSRLPELDGIDAPTTDLVIKGRRDAGREAGVRLIIEGSDTDEVRANFEEAMRELEGTDADTSSTRFRTDVQFG